MLIQIIILYSVVVKFGQISFIQRRVCGILNSKHHQSSLSSSAPFGRCQVQAQLPFPTTLSWPYGRGLARGQGGEVYHVLLNMAWGWRDMLVGWRKQTSRNSLICTIGRGSQAKQHKGQNYQRKIVFISRIFAHQQDLAWAWASLLKSCSLLTRMLILTTFSLANFWW